MVERSQGVLAPTVLQHIFAVELIDRRRIPLVVFIEIAGKHLGINSIGVIFPHQQLADPGSLQIMLQIVNDVGQISLLTVVVGVIAEKNGKYLLAGHGAATAIHQICQHLLGLAAAEMDDLVIDKYIKRAEGADKDAGCTVCQGEQQVIQRMAYFGGIYRLEQIAAALQIACINGVFAVTGGKNKIDARAGFFCRLATVRPVIPRI